MSKKKVLGILILLGVVAWVVYDLNLVPQYTGLVNYGLSFLLGGFNANPTGIIAMAIGTASTVGSLAKLAWDRTKTNMEGVYGTIMGDKDKQLESLSNSYQTMDIHVKELEGQVSSYKSNLETTQHMLAETQVKLNDATAQIERKNIENNMLTRIEAEKAKLKETNVSVQKIMEASGATAQQAKQAIERAGRIVTVE